MTADRPNSIWLGLVIGNSRLHWAAFENQHWLGTWHTPHLSSTQVDRLTAAQFIPESWQGILTPAAIPALATRPASLWIASVVSTQANLWQGYDQVFWVERDRLPLDNLYGTLGIDRALALLGAGITYGWPVLVIDGGTALTLTAGVGHCYSSLRGARPALKQRPEQSPRGRFTGGAILPGLALQIRSLTAQTAALPEISLPDQLPPRWANTTVEAIQSGILHTVVGGLQAYIADWRRQYPEGQIILTGGDSDRLLVYLNSTRPNSPVRDTAVPSTNLLNKDPDVRDIRVDENLIFWGLQTYRNQLKCH